jgi:DNA-binding HxlR family transcriptional regulator
MRYFQIASTAFHTTSSAGYTRLAMAKRFDQYCPIAHALSLVGERWALLIVRELLRGPKRYTDLGLGLPGIGTNVLATRLRELEAAGVVRRRKLPPPAASMVYELTEYGAELEEVLHAAARWGARSLGLPTRDDDLDPDWGLNAFPALLYPERARGVTETYVVRVDDSVFTVALQDGRLSTALGETTHPDADMAMDMATFFTLSSGDLPPAEALADGRVRLDGDAEALERFFSIFSFAPRLAEPERDGERLGPPVVAAASART